jgi:hypothetical protein
VKQVVDLIGVHLPKEKVIAELYSAIKRIHKEASNNSNSRFKLTVKLEEMEE